MMRLSTKSEAPASAFPMILAAALLVTAALPLTAADNATNNIPPWISRPLSLTEAINLALKQNGNILRGQSDLEAQYGVVIQTRAVVFPRLGVSGNYQTTSATEVFPFPGAPPAQHQTWVANIQVTQSIYEGGRINSSLRSARLTKEQAVLQYQTVIADAVLQVRVAYYDVLSAAEQILVQEASVNLLTRELEDQTRRYEAGTVPRFNVLQAEVQLANARPLLIQARNRYRLAKDNLVNLLGYHVPAVIGEDLPLQLTDRLDAEPYPVDLAVAVGKALENRPELAALRKAEGLRKEGVIYARGGYKPSLEAFAGYGARNSSFNNDLAREVSGYTIGAQVNWNIFDGFLTKGRVDQAKALYQGSKVDVDNETRSIELEVRTAYSNFIEARETLESQKKVQEQAEEALRLARARSEAGTGTQLDVINAETSLTQARSTQVQALHDYDVARARLERAIGLNTFGQASTQPPNQK
ncbi:MAG: Outer rane efflux protein [Pedosphaera sp.]|nr:Outer rane efflux protein [Pedosphaera sp.]